MSQKSAGIIRVLRERFLVFTFRGLHRGTPLVPAVVPQHMPRGSAISPFIRLQVDRTVRGAFPLFPRTVSPLEEDKIHPKSDFETWFLQLQFL